METRSITHIKNDEGKTLVTIFRRFDGCPSGMGNDLARFLRNKAVVFGYTDKDKGDAADPLATCNCHGMEDLAAQVVTHLKNSVDGRIGNVFLHTLDSADGSEEYQYTITQGKAKVKDYIHSMVCGINLKCEAVGCNSPEWATLYEGPVDKFDGVKIEEIEEIDKITA